MTTIKTNKHKLVFRDGAFSSPQFDIWCNTKLSNEIDVESVCHHIEIINLFTDIAYLVIDDQIYKILYNEFSPKLFLEKFCITTADENRKILSNMDRPFYNMDFSKFRLPAETYEQLMEHVYDMRQYIKK